MSDEMMQLYRQVLTFELPIKQHYERCRYAVDTMLIAGLDPHGFFAIKYKPYLVGEKDG